MIIVALTDIHGAARGLDRFAGPLGEADLVLLAGDLTHFGGRDDAEAALQAVRQHNESVLAVPGNCDRPEVTDYLSEQGVGLHGHCTEVDGIAFLGLGGSLPAPGGTPNEFSEEKLGALLQRAGDEADPERPWVLLSHQPPADTAVDRVSGGDHVGSQSVRRFIERHEPLICFSGHIHESRGTDRIDATRLVNPGPARHGHYAWAELDGDVRTLEVRSV
ncbi:MAG: metallophosphoesterase [Planctomycetota bacterium]